MQRQPNRSGCCWLVMGRGRDRGTDLQGAFATGQDSKGKSALLGGWVAADCRSRGGGTSGGRAVVRHDECVGLSCWVVGSFGCCGVGFGERSRKEEESSEILKTRG